MLCGLLCLGLCLLLLNIIPYEHPKFYLHHNGLVHAVIFSPDGSLVTTASEGNECDLFIWDALNGHQLKHLSGCPDGIGPEIYSIAYSPDRTYWVVTGDATVVWILDAETGKGVRYFSGHTDRVLGASFSPDGKYVISYGYDRTARVWNAQTGSEVFRLDGHEGAVGDAAFSLDGRFIVTSCGNAHGSSVLRVWDATNGKELTRIRYGATSTQISTDGSMILTGSTDSTVRLWDARSRAEVRRFTIPGTWINFVFYDASRQRVIAVEEYGEVSVWDTNTQKRLAKFDAVVGEYIVGAAASPDYRLLAIAYETEVAVWSLDN